MFDEFKSAFQRPNNAHAQLIIINVVVFLVFGLLMVTARISGVDAVFVSVYNQFSIPPLLDAFLAKPWTLFTYFFAHHFDYQQRHADFYHILFNMLALYYFGRLFNEFLGSAKLVAVYILGGLAGGIAYLLIYNTIPFFQENAAWGMVGASAAVYAVMVAIATLLPDYTFHLLLIGPVRIKYIAFVLVVLSFIGSVGSNAGGNIAHLGGALIGYVYTRQLQAGINWGSWITITLDWFKDLFKPKRNVKVTYRNNASKGSASAKTSSAKATQSEIDAILDKISDRGYESLTKEEKEKLFNASKK